MIELTGNEVVIGAKCKTGGSVIWKYFAFPMNNHITEDAAKEASHDVYQQVVDKYTADGYEVLEVRRSKYIADVNNSGVELA